MHHLWRGYLVHLCGPYDCNRDNNRGSRVAGLAIQLATHGTLYFGRGQHGWIPLIADPGLEWAIAAPLFEMLLWHGGTVLAFSLSWMLVKSAKRPRSEVLLESAVFSSAGILPSTLLYLGILNWGGEAATTSHWSIGIGATIWIALGMAQLRRLEIGGALSMLRAILGACFLAIGGAQIALVVLILNPLFEFSGTPILGPSILNTLIPAYLFPAIILGLGALWLRAVPHPVRLGFIAVSVGLAGLWLDDQAFLART